MNNWKIFLLIVFQNLIVFGQSDVILNIKTTNSTNETVSIIQNRTPISEIKLNNEGTAEIKFSATEGIFQMVIGNENVQLFLKPKDNLKIIFDVKAIKESIKFEGIGAKENNFMIDFAKKENKFNYDALLEMDEVNFNNSLEAKMTSDLKDLDTNALYEPFVAIFKSSLNQGLQGLKQYYQKIASSRKLNNSVAPNFDYENHKGGKTSLESLKGKYVYIDVWATWCGPCRAEIPSLKKIEEKFHNKNIEFVSISVDVDKDYDKWKTFVKEKELGGTQLFADKNWLSDFIKAFGINSIPRFILIDPNGVVIDADAKRPSDPKLSEQLDGLLNKY